MCGGALRCADKPDMPYARFREPMPGVQVREQLVCALAARNMETLLAEHHAVPNMRSVGGF